MGEHDEHPAARDVVGVVGMALGVDPLDLGFKLGETRVHIGGQFLGASRLLRQAIKFVLRSIKGGFVFLRKLHRLRIGAAHAVAVRIVDMDFRPFPAFGFPHGVRHAPASR